LTRILLTEAQRGVRPAQTSSIQKTTLKGGFLYGALGLFIKKVRMSSSAHEIQTVSVKLINQQKVAADVTLSMIAPFAFQWMVQPFSAKWRIPCYQQQHDFFEPFHVVAP